METLGYIKDNLKINPLLKKSTSLVRTFKRQCMFLIMGKSVETLSVAVVSIDKSS